LAALLRHAFFASMTADEQRPTRGNLYIAAPSEAGMVSALTFVPQLDFGGAEDLARLCAPLTAEDSALIVAEYGGRFVCRGIGHLDDFQPAYRIFTSPQDWLARRGGVLVSSVAAGEIRLRQARSTTRCGATGSSPTAPSARSRSSVNGSASCSGLC
jgi:hypothetical protein